MKDAPLIYILQPFLSFCVISSHHIDFIHLISFISKRGKRADSAAPQTPQTEGRCRPNWPISVRGATGGPSGDGFLRLFESGDGRRGRSCCLGVFLASWQFLGDMEGRGWRQSFFLLPSVGFISSFFSSSFLVPVSSSLCEEPEAVSACPIPQIIGDSMCYR